MMTLFGASETIGPAGMSKSMIEHAGVQIVLLDSRERVGSATRSRSSSSPTPALASSL
jgi:hypothetical protein